MLTMVTAMMRPTMLFAILMVETVVALVSLQITALNVNVLAESLEMEFIMLLSVMVTAMMKPIMQIAIMMAGTVVYLVQ